MGELDHASDELRAKFAEFFDLYITVHPKESSKGYSFDITANIPLDMDDNTVNAYDMVFTPSRGSKGGEVNNNNNKIIRLSSVTLPPAGLR